MNAIIAHPDLLLTFVSYLSIPSLISLYAISRPFHYLFNRSQTAMILSCMRTWAPDSETVFPWRCYQALCIKDPHLRQKSSWQHHLPQARYETFRDVPSIRWLQMVIWRHAICKDMLIKLAVKGLRCPRGTLDTLKRLWFLIDLPLNAHRIALARTASYISSHNIYCATMFFLKVDMLFTDPSGAVYPVSGGQINNLGAYPRRWENCTFIGTDLRQWLCGERNLSSLWRVIRGLTPNAREPEIPLNRLDVLRLWVRHKYHLPDEAPDHVRRESIMGVESWEVGTANLERTGIALQDLAGEKIALTGPNIGNSDARLDQQMLYPHARRIIITTDRPRETLLRPDQLVMREGIRRGLELHRQWGRMMLWGFCDDLGRPIVLRSEEEIVKWNKGQKPLHPFKSEKRVLAEREIAAKKKAEEEAARRATELTEDKSQCAAAGDIPATGQSGPLTAALDKTDDGPLKTPAFGTMLPSTE